MAEEEEEEEVEEGEEEKDSSVMQWQCYGETSYVFTTTCLYCSRDLRYKERSLIRG